MGDSAEVKSVYEAICDRYNAGDRGELAGFYASDAIYLCPGEEKVTGREGKGNITFKRALHDYFIYLIPLSSCKLRNDKHDIYQSGISLGRVLIGATHASRK